MKSSWFIRHWPSDRVWGSWTHQQNIDIQQSLFDERAIAVHFDDIPSTKPEDYQEGSARNTMQRFARLMQEGGYICCDYPAIQKMLIAEVVAGSQIISTSASPYLKKVITTNAVEVSARMRVRLKAGAPRQGTLAKWQKIGHRLENMIKGTVEKAWDWLLPSEQETVCQEYLRSERGLRNLLMPFGRTLEDVDIMGITDNGRMIFAQVTLQTDRSALLKKTEGLNKYEREGACIMFCPKSKAAEIFGTEHSKHVEFVWTEDVWKWLCMPQNKLYFDVLFKNL